MAKKPLKIYWWRYDYPSRLNFGDEITPLLVQRLFGIKTTWAEPSMCNLVGAGSVMEVITEQAGDNKIAVWGSGYINQESTILTQTFNFAAVRGSLTGSRVGTKHLTLGDPGLLAPLAFPPSRKKRYKLGIVPHYVDIDEPVVHRLEEQGAKIINVMDTPEKVAHEITSCDLIFSSSLHGLIFSDAYGIPNYWTPFSDNLTGGSYKFDDYYSVFNKKSLPLNASNISPKMYDSLILEYQPQPSIETIQKSLIKSFPF